MVKILKDDLQRQMRKNHALSSSLQVLLALHFLVAAVLGKLFKPYFPPFLLRSRYENATPNLCSSAAVVPQECNPPSCVVARRPLCHKVNLSVCVVPRRLLCHKVNLPRYEARRRHFIMTCDILAPDKGTF